MISDYLYTAKGRDATSPAQATFSKSIDQQAFGGAVLVGHASPGKRLLWHQSLKPLEAGQDMHSSAQTSSVSKP